MNSNRTTSSALNNYSLVPSTPWFEETNASENCYAIKALDLLTYKRFPTYQECVETNKLQQFNPYACNLYLSHPLMSLDDGRIYQSFVDSLFRMINRCSVNKFLDDSRHALYAFDPEYIFGHTAGYDLYRQILEPNEEEMKILSNHLNLDLLSKEMIIDIFSFLTDIYVWVDWACAPRPFSSVSEEMIHHEIVSESDWIIENSFVLCLWEDEEQFKDAWCLWELSIAMRTNQILMYCINQDYKLTNHQISSSHPLNQANNDTANPRHHHHHHQSETRPLSTAIGKNEKEGDSGNRIPDFFFHYKKFPTFFTELLQVSKKQEFITIFRKNNITSTRLALSLVSNSSDGGKGSDSTLNEETIIDLFIKYHQKYHGIFTIYKPEYRTRVPKDFRNKLINHLKLLFCGSTFNTNTNNGHSSNSRGSSSTPTPTISPPPNDSEKTLFNPISFEYVSYPSITFNQNKYYSFIMNQLKNLTPFYSDHQIQYFPLPITCKDPFLLILSTYTLEEKFGMICNIEIELSQIKDSSNNSASSPTNNSNNNNNNNPTNANGPANNQSNSASVNTIERLESFYSSFDLEKDSIKYYPKINIKYPFSLTLLHQDSLEFLYAYKYQKENYYQTKQLCEMKFYKRARSMMDHYIFSYFYTSKMKWKERCISLIGVNELVYYSTHDTLQPVDSNSNNNNSAPNSTNNSPIKGNGSNSPTPTANSGNTSSTTNNSNVKGSINIVNCIARVIDLPRWNSMVKELDYADYYLTGGYFIEIYNTLSQKRELLLYCYLKETCYLFLNYFHNRNLLAEGSWLEVSFASLFNQAVHQEKVIDITSTVESMNVFTTTAYNKAFQQSAKKWLELKHQT